MRHTFLTATAVLAGLLSLPALPGAATLQGVTLADSVQIDGSSLKLQGLGLRKKAVVSVYVGGLYLTTPTSDGAAAARADEPKRISLTFVRNVDAASLKESFEEGLTKNSKDKLASMRSKADAFLKMAVSDVKKGDELSFTYVPGKGTRIALGATAKGTVEGKDIMEAIFSIWLGNAPPTEDLKKGMLGLAKP